MKCFVLLHPQSKQLINYNESFTSEVDVAKVSCGTTVVEGCDFSEARDFWPNYASWNSALFETSVILTVWKHIDKLITDQVAFLHSDVEINYDKGYTWDNIRKLANETNIGLTSPIIFKNSFNEFVIRDQRLHPKNDPMFESDFDFGINIWDYIKKYDHDMYDWAVNTQPQLIYAHQFACNKEVFYGLGEYLMNIVNMVKLNECGLWTPHIFERLIGLYLTKYSQSINTTAFWHHQSSGFGDNKLYGHRPVMYYSTARHYQHVKSSLNPIEPVRI